MFLWFYGIYIFFMRGCVLVYSASTFVSSSTLLLLIFHLEDTVRGRRWVIAALSFSSTTSFYVVLPLALERLEASWSAYRRFLGVHESTWDTSYKTDFVLSAPFFWLEILSASKQNIGTPEYRSISLWKAQEELAIASSYSLCSLLQLKPLTRFLFPCPFLCPLILCSVCISPWAYWRW